MQFLTEDEFYEGYTPIKNHFDDNASEDGCMFETYGQELDYVIEMAKENRVVTIVLNDEDGDDEDGDEDDNAFDDDRVFCYYLSGYHIVNRHGYLILDKPYVEDFEVKVS
jgi:hypothetical protein